MATGQPWLSAAGSALGAWNQNRENRAAASRQMNFQRSMSNSSYQRAMEDMRLAGLNPILAYQQGGASTPAGASYTAQNVGSSAASGGLKGAQQRNLAEQNNNLQANSALQRMQTYQAMAQTSNLEAQTRRTQLENEAYGVLSPEMRAIALSGSGAHAATSAASRVLQVGGRVGKAAVKAFNPLTFFRR